MGSPHLKVTQTNKAEFKQFAEINPIAAISILLVLVICMLLK